MIDDGTLVRSATARPGPLGVHEFPSYSLTSQCARGSASASGARDQGADRADPEVADIVAALHVESEHIAFEGKQLRFVQVEHWTAKQRAEERYQVLSAFEARDIVGRMAASPLVASQMKQALTRAAPRLAEVAAGATRGKLLLLYRTPTVTARVPATEESITPSQFRRMLGKQNDESHSIEFRFETVSGHKISDSHPYFLTHPDGSIETGQLSNGKFRRENVDEGSYQLQFQYIDDLSWDTEEAEGEPAITMTANTVRFPDGTPVKFAVYRHAPSTEAPLNEVTGNVVSDQATAKFQYRQSLQENPGGVFVFVATIGNKRALSSQLTIRPYQEESIGWIQQRLKALGHDPGPIDGVSGARTAAALRDFQSTIPELVESGEPDPDTLIELATA